MTNTNNDSFMDLTNQFLIAMPGLHDPMFSHSVIYICEHGDEGAIGLIINAPLDITLKEVLKQMSIESEFETVNDLPVLFGGPVQQERGFVVHKQMGKWMSSLEVGNEIAVTTSQDILQALSENKGPSDILIALGYAGWAANQLEQEILDNLWLSCPASADILFHTPFEERWEKASRSLGISMSEISGQAGHA